MAVDDFWRKHYEWMNDDQWECFLMLCDLYRGPHHVRGKVKACGVNGIEINTRLGSFSTFDFNDLTRAVIMAHDRLIRFEIMPSGPGLLKLQFHRRHQREGMMHERHPTIEEAIVDQRGTDRQAIRKAIELEQAATRLRAIREAWDAAGGIPDTADEIVTLDHLIRMETGCDQ